MTCSTYSLGCIHGKTNGTSNITRTKAGAIEQICVRRYGAIHNTLEKGLLKRFRQLLRADIAGGISPICAYDISDDHIWDQAQKVSERRQSYNTGLNASLSRNQKPSPHRHPLAKPPRDHQCSNASRQHHTAGENTNMAARVLGHQNTKSSQLPHWWSKLFFYTQQPSLHTLQQEAQMKRKLVLTHIIFCQRLLWNTNIFSHSPLEADNEHKSNRRH